MNRRLIGVSLLINLGGAAPLSCSYSQTCEAGGVEGVCVSISSGCCTGLVTSGLCSGGNDIKCCTENICSTPYGDGTCMDTGSCTGTLYGGYCTGPSDVQCCVTGGTDVEFGPNPYYYDNWCGAETYALPYLDDKYCQKKFPTAVDREWSCPVSFDADHGTTAGYSADAPLSSVEVDTTALAEIVDPSVAHICIILTRRSGEGRLYNKYFCNSAESQNTPYETWSSSKIFAMANAAGELHTECADANMGAATTGTHGTTPLGDLSTIICSYDSTQGYSSNSLSSYFHDLGWRQRAHDMVTQWLGRSSESLGGNYGEASPSDLGFSLSCANGGTCEAAKDPQMPTYPNSLSMLSAAEMTRRLVLHRELESSLRFPNTSWTDMQTIMYGAEKTVLFPTDDLKWGGMTADTSVYVQSSVNITDVEVKSQGQWRIFSKLGAGYSSSRSRGEIINNAYGCFPELDESGSVKQNSGYEFTLTVRGSVPGDTALSQAESNVYAAVSQTLAAIYAGKLQ